MQAFLQGRVKSPDGAVKAPGHQLLVRGLAWGLPLPPRRQGICTSIKPSAFMLTSLVPASMSGAGAASSAAMAFIAIGALRR